MDKQIKVSDTPDKLYANAAGLISELTGKFLSDNGKCTLVLSGGSTPKGLYTILSSEAYRREIKWDNIYLFWGDERCVPPDNSESNYKMAFDSLISKINIPEKNIFRILAEKDHERASSDYESRLKKFFGNSTFPSFDIVLLGLGDNGHTASLFDTNILNSTGDKWVADTYVEELSRWRITLTLPVINYSKNIIFLIKGKEKASIVKKVVKEQDRSYPASYVNPANGNLIWCMDKDAASLIL
jgi:6-phosphogluconolactonase